MGPEENGESRWQALVGVQVREDSDLEWRGSSEDWERFQSPPGPLTVAILINLFSILQYVPLAPVH